MHRKQGRATIVVALLHCNIIYVSEVEQTASCGNIPLRIVEPH
jgi:hypothetical protein